MISRFRKARFASPVLLLLALVATGTTFSALSASADCGMFYLELGVPERSKACFELADRLQPGISQAYQLVHLAKTKPDVALAQGLEAAKARPEDAYLASAIGWVLFHQQHKLAEAKVWVDKALAIDGNHHKAMSLKWQLCEEEKDWLCVIEYRVSGHGVAGSRESARAPLICAS